MNASVDTLTISGLWPSRMYSLHLMASTMGGSTNGTSLVITTKDMGKENPGRLGLGKLTGAMEMESQNY